MMDKRAFCDDPARKALDHVWHLWRRANGYETGSAYMDDYKNNREPGDGSERGVKKAAMYVRMSTDHQKYSTENQEHSIRE